MTKSVIDQSKNRLLVTGSNGFVGKALCGELCERGFAVREAVRSASSLVEKAEIVAVGAIDSKTNWNEALRNVDAVVHLAARVHVMDDKSSNPLDEYRKVNVKGTKCLAIAAAKAGIKRFVYISSVKVNGEGKAAAYTEYDEEAPADPYGVSKWEAEQELHKISDTTGIEVVILRPPLVYGPGVKANFLRLFKIVKRGIPLPLSSIKNRRSFIYLGNLIDAIITCINHTEAAGHTFLVCDEENITTPGLIRQIALALEKPARLFFIPPYLMRLAGKFIGKSAAIDRLFGSLTIDSTKIRKELGWKPPYTMEYGLKETAKWYTKKMVR